MLKFVFYVPKEELEAVKMAVFEAGAGQIGAYKYCAWQVLGKGQFLPLPGSEPYIGQENELTFVEEYRVETICSEDKLQAVIEALKTAHPYEEPVYESWCLGTSSCG